MVLARLGNERLRTNGGDELVVDEAGEFLAETTEDAALGEVDGVG